MKKRYKNKRTSYLQTNLSPNFNNARKQHFDRFFTLLPLYLINQENKEIKIANIFYFSLRYKYFVIPLHSDFEKTNLYSLKILNNESKTFCISSIGNILHVNKCSGCKRD